ncbi:necrotizing enteritis toxin NetF (plasmid) [Clostridium perfringens]|uniref:Leukocidin/Hemolysin toxin family n=2 Tax=Clostridium perfringens TaxID=1502 RepID=A0A0D3QGV4_CLOPF|nr:MULTISPECIES: necrotizing enteritis toxin NetF [Clostridium]AJF36069.1 necrotizing enteritis toxin NetF [Clostridium perfringens]AKF16652.1 Leukocidin/Hemolysin toxin family [Clostridium perfringens]AMN30651.1 necrotizing enteritis toxin NetF [Clostridium perfringens]AMN30713.1 necrotizing enteritis toxin NetF [Clostridium perfringens]MDK7591282.1 necrotizing enteritis toxin NetF [Clostridium sp. UMB9555B]
MKKTICTGITIFSLLLGNITQVKANSFPESIINSKGKQAEVYTSSDASERDGIKTSLSASFIEDPNSNNLTALVSLKGFIPSGLIKTGTYYSANMYWPSKYNINIETTDEKNNVKILESIPSNTIETVRVTESMGYSIGGNVSVSKKSSSVGANAGFNVQRSVQYEQPDFKTIQKSDGIRKASWNIVFNKTKDGYDQNSYHALYGNQLFMKSRLHNTGAKNLVEDKDLSPLISGGFTPNMVIALKAPKGTKKSMINLNYNLYQDLYTLEWYKTQWWGENRVAKEPYYTYQTYELDWENHTVEFIY